MEVADLLILLERANSLKPKMNIIRACIPEDEIFCQKILLSQLIGWFQKGSFSILTFSIRE